MAAGRCAAAGRRRGQSSYAIYRSVVQTLRIIDRRAATASDAALHTFCGGEHYHPMAWIFCALADVSRVISDPDACRREPSRSPSSVMY